MVRIYNLIQIFKFNNTIFAHRSIFITFQRIRKLVCLSKYTMLDHFVQYINWLGLHLFYNQIIHSLKLKKKIQIEIYLLSQIVILDNTFQHFLSLVRGKVKQLNLERLNFYTTEKRFKFSVVRYFCLKWGISNPLLIMI